MLDFVCYAQDIIDDQDEKLKALLNEYGDEVYQAVVTALKEMDDCNASGRYVVPVLWNFKVNRKATAQEAVAYIVKQWKFVKRRKL